MTMTYPTASYRGSLPDDVFERLEPMGGGTYYDPTDGSSWTDEGRGVWSRWPAPEVHDRNASYGPLVRAALAPTEAFTGPEVTGWVLRHHREARSFVDIDGRKIEAERFAPRATFDLSDGPPLTDSHERSAKVLGKFVRGRNTGGGLWVTWRLATDLPDSVRARLGDPHKRPQLSAGFFADPSAPPVEYPNEWGDGLVRMWMGRIRVDHVALVGEHERGAYADTDLDRVEF
jgi:hypothetical protein